MMEQVKGQTGGADAAAQARKKQILEAPDTVCARRSTYYVSQRGDDANDGLSPERPRRSFEGLEALPLEAGDAVLFERGSVFRTAQKHMAHSGVYFGAYGTGDKPRIYGSLRDYADPAIWHQTEDPAVWCTPLQHTRAGIATFNHDTLLGRWRYTRAELERDGDFYHTAEEGVFYLYFTGGNPGEYFDNIEISTTDVAFRGSYIEDFQAENLHFQYFTFGPFHLGEIDRVEVRGCVVGWCGGKLCGFDERRNVPSRYGNAFQVWYFGSHITVKNCWIYQQFDAALTFQGFGEEGARFEHICFADNLIEYCCMNIEFWAGRATDKRPPHIDHILYKGNLIRFAGYGWGGLQRCKKENQGSLLGWYNLYEDLHDFVITENVLDCADCALIYTKSPKEQAGLTVTDNTYYQKTPSGIHDYVEIVKGLSFRPTGAEALEQAIATFDAHPRLVKWLG